MYKFIFNIYYIDNNFICNFNNRIKRHQDKKKSEIARIFSEA